MSETASLMFCGDGEANFIARSLHLVKLLGPLQHKKEEGGEEYYSSSLPCITEAHHSQCSHQGHVASESWEPTLIISHILRQHCVTARSFFSCSLYI